VHLRAPLLPAAAAQGQQEEVISRVLQGANCHHCDDNEGGQVEGEGQGKGLQATTGKAAMAYD